MADVTSDDLMAALGGGAPHRKPQLPPLEGAPKSPVTKRIAMGTAYDTMAAPSQDDQFQSEDSSSDSEHEHGHHEDASEMSAATAEAHKYIEELEGDNWKSLPYKAPNTRVAEYHRAETTVLGGLASVWTTKVHKLGAVLGPGMLLYFRLLYYLALMLSLMTLIGIPTFSLTAGGRRVAEEEADPFGISKLTLANVGVTERDAREAGLDHANQTTTPFLGGAIKVTAAANIIGFTDWAQTAVFLSFTLFFTRHVRRMKELTDLNVVTPKDFAVYVRGLPEDATEAEIRNHFSHLYDLSTRDWAQSGLCGTVLLDKKSRPPLSTDKAMARANKRIHKFRAGGAKRLKLPVITAADQWAVGAAAENIVGYRADLQDSFRGGVPSPNSPSKKKKSKGNKISPYAPGSAGGAGDDDGGGSSTKGRRGSMQKPGFRRTEQDHDHTRSHIEPMPVCNTLHCLADPSYLASWVAEVSVVHPNSGVIRRYLRLKTLQRRIVSQRARVVQALQPERAYAEFNSKSPPDWRKATTGADPDAAAFYKTKEGKVMKKHLKYRAAQERALEKLEKQLKKLTKVTSKNIASTKCKGAFVMFNEEDSLFRCLEDYERGWSLPILRHCLQPKTLRFRGKHALHVISAPEPEDIKWSNIDYSYWKKKGLRAVSDCITLVFLLVSMLVILAATLAKEEVRKDLPSFALCGTELPANAYGTIDFPAEFEIRRNRSADAMCGEGRTFLHFYPFVNGASEASAAFVTATNITDDPNGNFRAAVCRAVSACVPTDATSEQTCSKFSEPTETYPQDAMIGCYCKTALQNAIDTDGLFGATSVLESTESDLCLTVALNFASAQVLMVVAAGAVAAVNAALKVLLTRLAAFERHDTLSEQSVALTYKLFLAQYANSGLILLIVNANLPSLVVFEGAGLFEGPFGDFEPAWHSTVGVALVITLVITAFAPLFAPVGILMVKRLIRKCSMHGAPSQEVLNQMYEGPTMHMDVKYTVSMNVLFCVLTYSGGVPVMLPIGAAIFTITYWADKWALLRFFHRPPRYDEKLPEWAARMMPWAGVMHLAISVWMFSNEHTLPLSVAAKADSALQSVNPDESSTSARAALDHTAPLTGLLAIVLLWKLSTVLLKWILVPLVYLLTCGSCGGSSSATAQEAAKIRATSPAYSDVYLELVSKAEATALASRSEGANYKDVEGGGAGPDDAEDGHTEHGRWAIITVGDNPYRTRLWRTTGKRDGVPHYKDQQMLTWQVMREHTIHTYRILANRHYRRAMRAVWADTARFLKEQEARGRRGSTEVMMELQNNSRKMLEQGLADVAKQDRKELIASGKLQAGDAAATSTSGAAGVGLGATSVGAPRAQLVPTPSRQDLDLILRGEERSMRHMMKHPGKGKSIAKMRAAVKMMIQHRRFQKLAAAGNAGDADPDAWKEGLTQEQIEYWEQWQQWQDQYQGTEYEGYTWSETEGWVYTGDGTEGHGDAAHDYDGAGTWGDGDAEAAAGGAEHEHESKSGGGGGGGAGDGAGDGDGDGGADDGDGNGGAALPGAAAVGSSPPAAVDSSEAVEAKPPSGPPTTDAPAAAEPESAPSAPTAHSGPSAPPVGPPPSAPPAGAAE